MRGREKKEATENVEARKGIDDDTISPGKQERERKKKREKQRKRRLVLTFLFLSYVDFLAEAFGLYTQDGSHGGQSPRLSILLFFSL